MSKEFVETEAKQKTLQHAMSKEAEIRERKRDLEVDNTINNLQNSE